MKAKNQIKFLFLFIGIFMAISCKKEKTTTVCQPKTITTNNLPTLTETIKYDDQNRISEYATQNVRYKFIYTGLSGKLELYLADTVYRTDNLTFDNSGRLTSYEERTTAFGGLRYYYAFTYNSDGYLFTNIQTLTGPGYDNYYKDSLIYTNGNLTQKITKYVDGTLNKTINYTYGTTVNKTWNFYWNGFTEPFDILSGYIFLFPFLGKPSKNLPTAIVYTEGSFVDNFSYDYLLNTDGYVSEYNEYRSNTATGNTTSNHKLEYTCN